ncbi:hypothetical protein HanHA300_Chr09g0321011 [Helianthus annuus]|nr:hypothetical protein HanHA300_Chr09g0321011 [Helianthus annuus]KAJ0540600.1 hypothetical protein HanHA89_Chr09g0318631 [Helianthus annuus]KAJ0705754.1 hypothetical protein HanLR1_Chr09g0298941 [Helianthus annuus]KAJ0709899.1 hypothetical protein HanOQP8_Chr09g0305891 [Helianthus annuus]
MVENGSELEKSTPEERSGFDGCGIQVQIVFAYNQQMGYLRLFSDIIKLQKSLTNFDHAVRKRDCNEGPRDYS